MPSAAPAPLEWTEIDWTPHVHRTLIGGRRFQYLDYGEGPVLLLVHGLGGAWQNWLENLPALGREFRVLAVDLPGFGGSDPLPPPAAMETHAEVLAVLLDRLGIDRVTIVGHSMGGLVTVLFAQAHEERLNGVVMVCAGGIELGWWRLQAIVQGFTLFNAIMSRPGVVRAVALRPRLRNLLMSGALGDPSAVSPALASQVLPPMAEAPGFLDALSAGSKAVAEARAEDIRLPTLMIWGEQDPILPVQRARELAEAMPDASLVAFPGVGHCPMMEVPRAFDEALLTFARRVSRPAAPS
jgi:pimeloyl-ACP methyl ester carboxylesterase